MAARRGARVQAWLRIRSRAIAGSVIFFAQLIIARSIVSCQQRPRVVNTSTSVSYAFPHLIHGSNRELNRISEERESSACRAGATPRNCPILGGFALVSDGFECGADILDSLSGARSWSCGCEEGSNLGIIPAFGISTGRESLVLQAQFNCSRLRCGPEFGNITY